MKKIIAAALSILVGTFGFTIVDKELIERVDNLEYSVSSMQERIDQMESSTSETTKDMISSMPVTTQDSQPLEVGYEIPVSDNQMEKFLIEWNGRYSNYIRPGMNNGAISTVDFHVANTLKMSYNAYTTTSTMTSRPTTTTTTKPFTNTTKPTTKITTTQIISTEYFIYIDNATAKISNIYEDKSSYYDSDYSVCTKVYKTYSVDVCIKGHTSEELAGNYIKFNEVYISDICMDYYETPQTTINSDGTFEVKLSIDLRNIYKSYTFSFDWPKVSASDYYYE